MKRFILVLIVFSTPFINIMGQDNEKLQSAIEMYQKGEYKSAISEFQSILKKEDKNINAWLYLSYSALANGEFELSKNGFKKVQEYSKNDEINSACLLGLGSIDLELGDFEDAVSKFSKAILLNSNNSEIYIFRGDAYLELDDYNMALNDYNNAIKSNPSNSLAYFSKGQLLCDIGEYQQASQNFLKAYTLNPDQPDYDHWQGICFFYLNRFEEAIIHIDAAIDDEFVFDLWELYYYRGASNYYLSKFDEAVYDFTLSLNEKNDPFTYYKQGLAYTKLEDYSLAKKCFEKAINISPDNPEYFNSMAYICVLLEDYSYAKKMINEAKKIGNENYYTSMVDGFISLNENNFVDAINKLEESLDYMKKKKIIDPDPYFYIGKAYFGNNDVENACVNLKQYMKFGGNSNEAIVIIENNCSL